MPGISKIVEYILFTFTATVYSVMIAFMFFKKKKVNTLENILYSFCLGTIIIQLILNMANFFMTESFWSLATK